MYVQDGRLVVSKGMGFTSFMEAYEAIPIDMEIGIHFRTRTHGDVNLANTHPYVVLNELDHGVDLLVMHNGIIKVGDNSNKSMSDTWHWIEQYARPLLEDAPHALAKPAMQRALELTTADSRLLFLDSAGNFTFLHQEDWVTHQGCWLSNDWFLNWGHSYRGYQGGYSNDRDFYDTPLNLRRTADEDEPFDQQVSFLLEWDSLPAIYDEEVTSLVSTHRFYVKRKLVEWGYIHESEQIANRDMGIMLKRAIMDSTSGYREPMYRSMDGGEDEVHAPD
jgi:hypothetical protein